MFVAFTNCYISVSLCLRDVLADTDIVKVYTATAASLESTSSFVSYGIYFSVS